MSVQGEVCGLVDRIDSVLRGVIDLRNRIQQSAGIEDDLRTRLHSDIEIIRFNVIACRKAVRGN